jgi:hypothetical protein
MQRFPHIYDIKQYWIQKMKEMWFWVKILKYAKNHQKLGKAIMDHICMWKSFEMRPKDQFMSCCDKQKTLVEKI